ncbi:50S ribosomal protein L15 [Pasteuria penetrans]|uniref:50S ribosomal protein L15 n=1 Tax=Pasteuria penetrans TaxID=86005 RepID=UPI000FA2AA9B|nr:50S ribosomal protein L15 [Pasteuria penetrans]
MVRLHELQPAPGARRKPKRVGRGKAAGQGKFAGRGMKGQNSRSGGGVRPGFEGGQNPLYRRLPKRGFTNPFRTEYAIVNVSSLQSLAEEGVQEITPQLLHERRIVRKLHRAGLRVLGDGELTKMVKVQAHYFSGAARRKIEAAGGVAVDLTADKGE